MLGQHIGEKSQVAAVDPQERHPVPGHEPRRIEKRTVAADGDDKVRARGELPGGHTHDIAHGIRQRGVRADQHFDLPRHQMRHENAQGLRDLRVRKPADERARANGKGHPTPPCKPRASSRAASL